MKVSIITCTLNSSLTISDTIYSVNNQTYHDFEHIIVDGLSSDDTLEKVKSLSTCKHIIIREKDTGLYDAMNKGIRAASGDIVGILNADDFYTEDDFIEKIVCGFEDNSIEAVYSDVRFIKNSNPKKTVRYYSSKHFSSWMFRFGFMPAHPTFFTWKRNFEKYGYYKTDYQISSDFELLVRFLHKHRLKSLYLPISGIKMRLGGVSTRSLKSNIILNKEDVKACRGNGIYTNFLLLMPKYLFKVFELIITHDK